MRTRAVLFMILMFSTSASQVWGLNQPTENLDSHLNDLETFLLNQYDPEVGLVRESPDPTIDRTYWLLSDNLLAYHALKPRNPEVADSIFETLQSYGYLKNGLYEVIFGEEIQLPPYTPRVLVIENKNAYTIKTEIRSKNDGTRLMDDWIEYADLLLYGSLNFYNKGDLEKALHYYDRAANMWNELGLYDTSTERDGLYTTYKLALLLYVSSILNKTLPYRTSLEERIWSMQREDGGVRTHYYSDLTSDREANSETASLILICYNYEAKAKLDGIRDDEDKLSGDKRLLDIHSVLMLATLITFIVIMLLYFIRRRTRVRMNNKVFNSARFKL